jgi:hypothetical protein
MFIDFKKRRMKAFFVSGKPTLIMRINLPVANFENEVFNSRFNEFYERVFKSCVECGEAYSKKLEFDTRPASFTLETEEKTSPAGKISILRSFKLRLPSGEIKRSESIDVFDSQTGLFIKEKRKLKFTKRKAGK